jgi:hypothetical protein
MEGNPYLLRYVIRHNNWFVFAGTDGGRRFIFLGMDVGMGMREHRYEDEVPSIWAKCHCTYRKTTPCRNDQNCCGGLPVTIRSKGQIRLL